MGPKPSKINRLKCIDRQCHEMNEKLDLIMNLIQRGKIPEHREHYHYHFDNSLKKETKYSRLSNDIDGIVKQDAFAIADDSSDNHLEEIETLNCSSVIRYVLKSEHNIQISKELFSKTLKKSQFPELMNSFQKFIERNYSDQLKLFKQQNKSFCSISNVMQFHLIGLGENPSIYADIHDETIPITQIYPIPGMSKLMFLGFDSKHKSMDFASPNLIYFHVVHDPIHFRYSPANYDNQDKEMDPNYWKNNMNHSLYIPSKSSDRIFAALWELELHLAFFAFLAEWKRNTINGVFDNMERIYCGLVYHHSTNTNYYSPKNIVDAQIFGRDSNLNTLFPNIYSIHQSKQFFLLKASCQ